MLGVRQATSIHRALTVTSVLFASLGAHAASTGQLQSLTVAPLIWGSIVAVSALVWPARRWQ